MGLVCHLDDREDGRKGWDFSHIHGRYEEEDSLPWDYEEIIRSVLKDEMKLFHISTGATKKRIVFRGITKKSSAASLRMK